MEQIENNVYFWQKLDTLFFSSKLVIERKKHTAHPKYANLIYPVDYGYLEDTVSTDGDKVDVFVGSMPSHTIDTIVITADILKRDIEVKLLCGCNEQEQSAIMHLLNESEFQKAILVRRTSLPTQWGMME